MTPAELFARITALLDKRRQPVIEGWCTPEKAFDLAASILTLRPELVFEVGVFGGSSLLPMALALQCCGKGQVMGVDPWSPEESVKGQVNAVDKEWWGRLDHEKIYQGFLEAVRAEGVSNQVVVLRKTSDATEAPRVIDLLHLDGNHGEQAYRDGTKFCPRVRIGGLVYLDDIGWAGGAVGKLATWMTANGFVELYKRDTGAMYQRIGYRVEVGGKNKKAKIVHVPKRNSRTALARQRLKK